MARSLALAVGLALCMVAVQCQLSPVAQSVLSNMDQSVSPCVDFYNYSCGGWFATHPIPGDKSRIDRSFEVITDRNTDILLQIAQNPSSGKVYQYYTACMNTQQIDIDGTTPLTNLWSALLPMSSVSDTLAPNLATLYKNGFSALFDLDTEIDSSDPAHMIYSFHQGGLTLPDPSYYLDSTIFDQYSKHITNMFTLAASPSPLAEAQAAAGFETQLANITVPADQLFDPFKSFNKMDWFDLMSLAPNIESQGLVNALNLKMDVALTIDAPEYFVRLSNLISSTSGSTIYSYMRWRVLHSMASRLPSAFVQENFNFFGRVLSGVSIPPPRNRTCLQATDAAMPELTGRLFAEQAFPESSKIAANIIFDGIWSAFEINSQKLDWMDPVTNQKAIQKLQQLIRLIGYPDNPRNYTTYEFGSHYSQNSLSVAQDQFRTSMLQAGKPSNRRQWDMSADTVNAYYSPPQGVVAIPAGILQSPFFDPAFPPAMNYGGIGMVGGHELTHALDSQGRDYTGQGKLEDWWAPRTAQEFQKRVDCIIQQYSKFSPLPGFYVNGNLTQGENIADTGGLKTAHSAYINSYPDQYSQPSIVPGLTNEQLFFVGFAQTWCSKLTPAAIKQRLLTDPHSPPRFRVNGPTMNLPAFSKAFQCPANSPMNPPQRCQIW